MIRHGLLIVAGSLLFAGAADGQLFGYGSFGDSITCGKYDTEDRSEIGPCANGSVDPLHPSAGYPARLRQAGRLNCPVDGSGGCMVYNYGKPGEKTFAGVTRIDNVLPQANFDVMLIMHGTNDVWNNVSNNTIESNLKAMEDKAKAKGVDTVFASIIRIHPESEKAYKNPQVEELKNDLAVIAANRGRWFANPWQVLCPGSSCFDQHYHFGGVETVGLHPDKSGYNILADAIEAAIKQAPVPTAPNLQAPPDGVITTSSKVSWSKSGHATWYQVQWDGGAGSRWVDAQAACPGAGCSWTIPGLATGATHSWRVRARNPRGRSAWSGTRTFTLVNSLPAFELSWIPGTLDFGVVQVGDSRARNATLKNSGELSISGLDFEFVGSGDYVVTTDGCSGALAPGASCSIHATFTPSAAGWRGGRLVVSSNQGITAELDLAGRGVAAGAGVKAVRLEVQTAFNGVLEPGEQVAVSPSWRNDEPTGQSLQGTADNFNGPGGDYYHIQSNRADYGSLAPGQVKHCIGTGGNCYVISVSNPANRPAVHWDASIRETLDGGMGTKTWTLHIGQSFDDVPRSALFYPSIEGIYHHGVTSGCGGGRYCPATGVKRAQMAAFLLRAIEGPSYTPPACTAGNPQFNDVPAGNPFCPWIEELANRGITSGCGGGNYCPADPVTRSAMAVFLLHASLGSDYVAPSCKGLFSDVACPSPFADWIEELVDRGITSGCDSSPPRFCPAQGVTRAQMAAFLADAFGLSAYGP